MGAISFFLKEKLIIGILISRLEWKGELLKILEREFGPVDYESRLLPFHYTDYYHREMGEKIWRLFISFKDLIPPDLLAGIKARTNEIEKAFSEQGHRFINLDPGIINRSHLLLATTKDGSHRIPLCRGIFAEVTLVYEKAHFKSLEWTYPDYRSDEYKEILHRIRGIYKKQIKPKEKE
jgi:hypothetical protein